MAARQWSRLPEDRQPRSGWNLIVVEGPVGVGKTTLARKLAETFSCATFLEQHEGNPFLSRFHENQRGMALPAQLCFLLQHSRQLATLRQADFFKSARVADFLFQKDRVFARFNLDDDEYALYQQVHAHLAVDPPVPDLVVGLQATPETLMKRMVKRGTDGARRMDLACLKKVCAAYVEFFHHYEKSPLLLVNTDDFDLAEGRDEYQLLLQQMSNCSSGRHYLNPLRFPVRNPGSRCHE